MIMTQFLGAIPVIMSIVRRVFTKLFRKATVFVLTKPVMRWVLFYCGTKFAKTMSETCTQLKLSQIAPEMAGGMNGLRCDG